MSEPPPVGVSIDLAAGQGRAVLWGLATDDLNVNLVAWPAGEGVDAHVNDARDVVLVVVDGELEVTIDEAAQTVCAGHCLVIPKGTRRTLRSVVDETRYLTVHRRRPPLTLGAE